MSTARTTPEALNQAQAWACPFCGEDGKQSKEHVWAQWLQDHSCVREELKNWSGERSTLYQVATTLGEDGRYLTAGQRSGSWADFLPHVTVKVCSKCNNGWMSNLETQVIDALGPVILDGNIVKLSPIGQHAIAKWAVKTFMTYALTNSEQQNPFTPSEYAIMASTQEIPDRAHVWMCGSESRHSAVGMAFNSWAMYPEFNPAADPDNCAHGFLAAGHVIFMLVLLPTASAEKLLKVQRPPLPAHKALFREITRAKRSWLFPVGKANEAHMDQVKQWLEMPMHIGMDPTGLTPGQVRAATSEFLAGADWEDVRSKYASLRNETVSVPPREWTTEEAKRAQRQAKRMATKGHTDQAIELLRDAGRRHLDVGDPTSAERLLAHASELSGEGLADPDVVNALGLSRLQLGKWEAAAADFRQAIQLGLRDPAIYGDLADALTLDGRFANALEVLEELAQSDLEIPPRAEFTRATLTHIVHELGVSIQTRNQESRPPADADEDTLRRYLVEFDALSQPAWQMWRTTDLLLTFHIARAWIGRLPFDWFSTGIILLHNVSEQSARDFMCLGYEAGPELAAAEASILRILTVAKAPEIERFRIICHEEAGRNSSTR